MNLARLLSSDTSSPLSKVIQTQRVPSLPSVVSVDQVSQKTQVFTQAQSTCRPLNRTSSSSSSSSSSLSSSLSDQSSSDPVPPAHVDPHVIAFLKMHLGDAKWRIFSSRLCERRSINPAQIGKSLCGGNGSGNGNNNSKSKKKEEGSVVIDQSQSPCAIEFLVKVCRSLGRPSCRRRRRSVSDSGSVPVQVEVVKEVLRLYVPYVHVLARSFARCSTSHFYTSTDTRITPRKPSSTAGKALQVDRFTSPAPPYSPLAAGPILNSPTGHAAPKPSLSLLATITASAISPVSSITASTTATSPPTHSLPSPRVLAMYPLPPPRPPPPRRLAVPHPAPRSRSRSRPSPPSTLTIPSDNSRSPNSSLERDSTAPSQTSRSERVPANSSVAANPVSMLLEPILIASLRLPASSTFPLAAARVRASEQPLPSPSCHRGP
jgi:hypothetical protein